MRQQARENAPKTSKELLEVQLFVHFHADILATCRQRGCAGASASREGIKNALAG
jgi:hypothetical protein